ncbi:MAG: hypothetical protein JW913_17335 [Chitinispirillaceae bacterium]|nr:hypothetical protein [Chitinispirillaceae bacterium]
MQKRFFPIATTLTILLLTCPPSMAQAPSPQIPPVPATKGQSARPAGKLGNKERVALAGSILFASGCLIQYGLVMPQSARLSPTDLEDQLALLSPSILASGLRYAGPPMGCMRTSEAAQAWADANGIPATRNYAWKLYFCGWGLTIAAGLLNVAGFVIDTLSTRDNLADVARVSSLAVAIGADMAWAATSVYAMVYLRRLKGTQPATKPPRVSITPAVLPKGGMALTLGATF